MVCSECYNEIFFEQFFLYDISASLHFLLATTQDCDDQNDLVR